MQNAGSNWPWFWLLFRNPDFLFQVLGKPLYNHSFFENVSLSPKQQIYHLIYGFSNTIQRNLIEDQSIPPLKVYINYRVRSFCRRSRLNRSIGTANMLSTWRFLAFCFKLLASAGKVMDGFYLDTHRNNSLSVLHNCTGKLNWSTNRKLCDITWKNDFYDNCRILTRSLANFYFFYY